MTRRLILLAFLLCGAAFSQAVNYQNVSSTTNSACAPGALCPVLAIPGATVNVCTGSGLGVVNTAGTVVTAVSGPSFTGSTGTIQINGTPYRIQVVVSSSTLVLTTSAGTQTNAVSSTLSGCLLALATTYTGPSAGTSCPTTAQMVPLLGGVCTSKTDNQGNLNFWAMPGSYYYYVTVPATAGGQSSGPYPLSIGASVGCPLGVTCDANYTTLAAAVAAAGSGTLYITRSWSYAGAISLSSVSLVCQSSIPVLTQTTTNTPHFTVGSGTSITGPCTLSGNSTTAGGIAISSGASNVTISGVNCLNIGGASSTAAGHCIFLIGASGVTTLNVKIRNIAVTGGLGGVGTTQLVGASQLVTIENLSCSGGSAGADDCLHAYSDDSMAGNSAWTVSNLSATGGYRGCVELQGNYWASAPVFSGIDCENPNSAATSNLAVSFAFDLSGGGSSPGVFASNIKVIDPNHYWADGLEAGVQYGSYTNVLVNGAVNGVKVGYSHQSFHGTFNLWNQSGIAISDGDGVTDNSYLTVDNAVIVNPLLGAINIGDCMTCVIGGGSITAYIYRAPGLSGDNGRTWNAVQYNANGTITGAPIALNISLTLASGTTTGFTARGLDSTNGMIPGTTAHLVMADLNMSPILTAIYDASGGGNFTGMILDFSSQFTTLGAFSNVTNSNGIFYRQNLTGSLAMNTNFTTATLGNVTGMVVNVNYPYVLYEINVTASASADATGGIQIKLTTPNCTVSFGNYPTIFSPLNVSGSSVTTGAATSLGVFGAGGYSAAGATQYAISIQGWLVCSTVGTVQVQFAESVATGTAVLRAGSYINVIVP